MNSSKFRFVLDLHSTQSQISIPVTKGDTARVWYISLSDGGQPYIIEDGCLAKMEIKRPTGSFLEAFCPIENNTTIVYDFSQDEITKNTAAVDGVHDCSATIYDKEGAKIASPRFCMIVSPKVVNSDDIGVSEEDKTTIDAMIAAEASRREAEIGRVNAEAERIAAEEQRKSNEIARQNSLTVAVERVDAKISEADDTIVMADDTITALENKITKVDNWFTELANRGVLKGNLSVVGTDGNGGDLEAGTMYIGTLRANQLGAAAEIVIEDDVYFTDFVGGYISWYDILDALRGANILPSTYSVEKTETEGAE